MRMMRAWMVAATLLAAAPLAPPARAGEATLRVTTESAEYCAELSSRLNAMPASTNQLPHTLAQEGRRLCATGHVRTGIAKLRRAIRLSSELRAGS